MPSDPASRRPRLPARFAALLALLACAALACGRDLAVPLLLPPQLTSVTPAAAFAGERVLLAGAGLGNGAGATVQIGGRTAEAAPLDATLPAETLAVLLPAELAPGALEVSVTTAAGKSTLPGAIRSRGLGHPAGLGLQGRYDLGVFPSSLAVLGDNGWISDLAHDEVVAIDPLTGQLAGLVPLHGANGPSLVFGTSTAPWVYSVGDLGHHPQLDRFDLSGDLPLRTCSSGELAAIGDGTHPAQVWGAVASADGTLLAAPTFGKSIALIDTSACPPVVTTVALPEKVRGVALSGREALVALVDQFARVLASGAVVPGPVLDEDTSIYQDGAMALDPREPRLAYVRADGNVGFARWSGAGGPVVDDGYIFTYGAVQKLAFGPAPGGATSDRLYLRQNDRLVVYDLSVAPPALAGTAVLEGVGLPLHVLETGEVLAGITDGTALFSRDGASLRTWTLTGALPAYSLAVGPDDRVLVAGKFGATAVLPDFSGGHTSFDEQGRAVQLTGLSGSEGPPVGWLDNLVYGYSTTTLDWTVLATLPPEHLVWQADRDASGKYAAAYGWDGDVAWLDVLGPGAPARLTLPAAVERVRLTFGGGALWVLTQTGNRAAVYAVDPAAPALREPTGFDPPADFTDPLAVLPFWSRGLGALVVSFADLRATGNGASRKVAGVLCAVVPGKPTRFSGPLPRSLANPVVLSPDGRMVVSIDQGQGGVDAALLSWDGDAVRVTWAGHTDLPGSAADAFFSAAGDQLFVTLPFLPAIAALQ